MERTNSFETTLAAATAADAVRRADPDQVDADIRDSRLAGGTELREAALEVAHPDRSVTSQAPDGEPGRIFADPGAGIGPSGGAQVGGAADVRAGMEVVGFDGESVGLVKEVRKGDFLLDRVMRRDLYVPLSAVEKVVLDVVPEQVVLNVRGADVAVMAWESPPLA